MNPTAKTAVDVEIAGETYTIRSEASPGHARQCAAYLDETLSAITSQGSLIEMHKAVILAALSITDQLLRAQAECEALREALSIRAARLADAIEVVRGDGGHE